MSENHRFKQAVRDGVEMPKDNYWGNVPTKICGAYGGAIGGHIVKNAVMDFGNKLADKENN